MSEGRAGIGKVKRNILLPERSTAVHFFLLFDILINFLLIHPQYPEAPTYSFLFFILG